MAKARQTNSNCSIPETICDCREFIVNNRADTNKDGKLSWAELKVYKAKLEANKKKPKD